MRLQKKATACARRARLEPHPAALSEAVLHHAGGQLRRRHRLAVRGRGSTVRSTTRCRCRPRSIVWPARSWTSAATRSAATSTAKKACGASSDVVALSSFAGVKFTPLKKIAGRRHLRLRPGARPAASDPPTPAADRSAGAHAHAQVRRTDQRLEPEHCAGHSSRRSRWCRRRRAGRGCSCRSAAACDLAQQLPTLALQRGAAVRGPGERHRRRRPQVPVPRPGRGGDFRGVLALEARPDPASATGKAFNLAIATKTGLRPSWCASKASLTQKAAQIRLTMLGAVATLSPDSFDNFIAKILPKDGLRVDFDFGVGLATDRGAFFEGLIRSAGTGGNPRPTTPPPPGVQPPPLPPLPPETGPGFGLTIPIGKSLGPLTIHNLQLRFGTEDVDGKTTYLIASRELDQHQARPGDGARRSRRPEVRRADSGQGRRREGQPRLRGCRRRRGAAERRLARDRREGLRDRRRLPVPRQGAAGLRGRHAADDQGAHHRQGVRPHRHEDAGRQQGLLAHRLHHRRRLPADPDRHGVRSARASAAWSRSTARSTKRRCARA